MLSESEIATASRYDDGEFCERYGVDKSRIASTERQRRSGIPDGLFCPIHAQKLEKRPDRIMAGQKRYTVS